MKLDHLGQPVQTSGTTKAAYGLQVCSAAFEALSSTIYSHMIIANLREYVSNAVDAHNAAGRGYIPIEVSLPTAINPAFIVSDKGNGLSDEEMWDIFAVFFKTTKESCDKSIGGFGVGAKCALYYSRSFTITTIHNGIKSTYCSYVNEENIPDLTLISSIPTEEHSGLTINVPVDEKDFSKFHNEAAIILSMFETKPIVHTEGFVFEFDDIHEQIVDRGFALIPRHNQSDLYSGHKAYALVGGVIYPIPSDCDTLRSNNFDIMVRDNRAMIIPFGIDQVKPVLSREAIKTSHEVVKLIDDTMSGLVQEYIDNIQELVDGKPTIIGKMMTIHDTIGSQAAIQLGVSINGNNVYRVGRRALRIERVMKDTRGHVSVVRMHNVGVYASRVVMRTCTLTIDDLVESPQVTVFYNDPSNTKSQFITATKKYIRENFSQGHQAIIVDRRSGIVLNDHMRRRLNGYLGGKCVFMEYDEYNQGYYKPPMPRTAGNKASINRGLKSANTLYCRYTCPDIGLSKISHHEFDSYYQYVWWHGRYIATSSMWPERKPLRVIIRTKTNARQIDALGIMSLDEYFSEVAKDYTDYHEYRELNRLFSTHNSNDVYTTNCKVVYENCSAMRAELRGKVRRYKKLKERYAGVNISSQIMEKIDAPAMHTEFIESVIAKYEHLSGHADARDRVRMRLKIEAQQAKISELQQALIDKGKQNE